MALSLGAMIQAARSQKNPMGDYIANYQNQIDRAREEDQRHHNNIQSIVGAIMGSSMGGGNGAIGGASKAGGAKMFV